MERTPRTRTWVERVIVTQGFCPFAAQPWRTGAISFVTVAAKTVEDALAELLTVGERLRRDEGIETALLVLPALFDRLDDYLDASATAEALLAEAFGGEFALATFHPDYRFAGLSADDPAHAIHRAPHPLWHLLREESLEEVVASGIDLEAVLARNRRRAAELGADWWAQWREG